MSICLSIYLSIYGLRAAGAVCYYCLLLPTTAYYCLLLPTTTTTTTATTTTTTTVTTVTTITTTITTTTRRCPVSLLSLLSLLLFRSWGSRGCPLVSREPRPCKHEILFILITSGSDMTICKDRAWGNDDGQLIGKESGSCYQQTNQTAQANITM